MKNQYWNYRAVLLKSKVCFVANLMEETDIPSLLHKCVSMVEKPRKGIGSYQSVARVLGEGSDGCNFK